MAGSLKRTRPTVPSQGTVMDVSGCCGDPHECVLTDWMMGQRDSSLLEATSKDVTQVGTLQPEFRF